MLTLPIKKKWFDMILSGEKKEEYREIKPYYTRRFRTLWENAGINGVQETRKIRFRNGYSYDSPSLVATVHLSLGEGRPEWGALSGVKYYKLHIHSAHEEKHHAYKNNDGR